MDEKEERQSFDLFARLDNRPTRSGKIRLYLDDVTAEKIIQTNAKLQALSDIATNLAGIADLTETLGMHDAAKALREIKRNEVADMEEYGALEKERDELAAKLDESALDVSLLALPRVVVKDCRRIAKKDLGIKGGVPDDRQEDFGDRVILISLTKSVEKIVEVASGGEVHGLDMEGAKRLAERLPPGEYERLALKVDDLSTRDMISEVGTAEPNF